jgi:hypothetical protein
MKTMIAATLFSLVIFNNEAKSQVGLALGVKGGVNVSNLTKNSIGNFDSQTNWAGGVFAGILLAKAFVIQPEFLVRKGGATQNANSTNTQVTLNYFQIPVLFKLRIPIGETVFPHVFAGPSYDYITSATYTRTTTQNGSTTNANATPIRRTGMGGLVGVGLDLEIDHIFLTADARYGFGFSNISSDYLAVRGTYYTIMVGIGFRLGSE